jgi:4-hydroxyphenylpyruvate dioxygenase-like putative hemolysin
MKNKTGEKSPFSKIGQIGVVVRNMNEAVAYYSSLGLGPFEALNVSRYDRRVHGKPGGDEHKNLLRVTQAGNVEFELIQPVSGNSIQKQFLEQKGEGINHLGFFVDDLEAEVAKLVKKGFKVINSVKYVGGGGVAYLDTDRIGGVCFELIQRPSV